MRSFVADPSEVARMQAASVGPGAIVGIVIVVFVVLLVVIDVSCYFVNNCGVTTFVCVHLCGRSTVFTKEKAMEEGERLVSANLLINLISSFVLV